MSIISRLEHELGIKGHENNCPACNGEKPPQMVEMTAYAVLLDTQQREVSDRVPVTCEYELPKNLGDSINVSVRIKEAPITLVPNRYCEVRAVVVFDQETGGSLSIGRPDWFHSMRDGEIFTITS